MIGKVDTVHTRFYVRGINSASVTREYIRKKGILRQGGQTNV